MTCHATDGHSKSAPVCLATIQLIPLCLFRGPLYMEGSLSTKFLSQKLPFLHNYLAK